MKKSNFEFASNELVTAMNKIQAEEDKKQAKWNKENKPDREFNVSDSGETFTFGVWKSTDGSIFYGLKTKNKKIPYRTQSLRRIESELVKIIKEL